MSTITDAGFASGAIGAGVNEAVINEIAKIKDPGTAQIVSAIIGAAAAKAMKAIGGNAGAGASAAASGTKWNAFSDIRDNPEGVRDGLKAGFLERGMEEINSIEEIFENPSDVWMDFMDLIGEIWTGGIVPSDVFDQILQSYYERMDRLWDGTAKDTGYEIANLTVDIVLSISGGGAVGTLLSKLPRLGKVASTIRSVTKYDIGAKSVSNRYLHIGGDIWKQGVSPRGLTIDEALGNNLGRNFPVVDKLENGVLTRIKSIDLSAQTYQTRRGIFSKLKADLDDLAAFRQKTWGKVDLRTTDYHMKELEVAIPNMNMSKEQLKGIEDAKAYATEHGISMKITVVE